MRHAFFLIVLFTSAALGSTLAAGEIHIHNDTGGDIYIDCTYVNRFEVHHGSSRKVSYKANVHDVRCEAHDHHNRRHIETRDFHFVDHHSRFTWNVGHN